MTTHSPVHLKPGEIVQHPEKGNGIVVTIDYGEVVYYAHRDLGIVCSDANLTGWERVETCTADERAFLDRQDDIRCVCVPHPVGGGLEEDCPQHGRTLSDWAQLADAMRTEVRLAGETVRPGHVQVRVDDLDLGTLKHYEEGDGWTPTESVAIRAAKAQAAQRAESTPPADEQDARWSMPAELSAKIAATCKAKIDEKIAEEQLTSTTVTLPCPDCGELFGDSAHVLTGLGDWKFITFDAGNAPSHRCPPVQPDEPQEFGARVAVAYPNGNTVHLLRVVDDSAESGCSWMAEDGRTRDWGDWGPNATVTLGWDE